MLSSRCGRRDHRHRARDRGVQVHVDPEKARRLGVSPGEVARIMAITFRGVPLPRVHASGRGWTLGVAATGSSPDVGDLKSLTVGLRDGARSPSTSRGDGDGGGARTASRARVEDGGHGRGTFEGKDSDQALKDVGAVMKSMQFRPARVELGTEIRQAQEQQTEMLVNMLLALLWSTWSWRPLRVFSCIRRW